MLNTGFRPVSLTAINIRYSLMNQVPNLRHLRAFKEVAKANSISKAASKIFLSQPAITQAISKLEKGLNELLFERRVDGMFTTEAGDVLLSRVEFALEYIKTGVEKAVESDKQDENSNAKPVDHMISTTQCRALVAVSCARNFSVAACDIGVSQPSLHRSARELEKLLNVSLFEKSGQGIELTKAGCILAKHVKLAFSELAQGFDELQYLKGHDSGSIKIGTLPLSRTYLLPESINKILDASSGVRINVVDGPYVDLLCALRHGELDMLLGALRNPSPVEDIIQEKLFEDTLIMVGRVGHPLLEAKKITLQMLAKYDWVVPTGGTPTRKCFEQLFSKAHIDSPAGIVETSSLILMRGLLTRSDRLAIISRNQVIEEINFGILQEIPFIVQGTERTIGITTRKCWRPTPTQQRFVELLREVAR